MNKKIMMVAVVLIFPIYLWASNHKIGKKVVPHVLQEKLLSEDYNVHSIIGPVNSPEIVWGPGGETKDPTATINAYTYVDPALAKATRKTDIAALAVKLRANTITDTERDDLLDKMLQEMGY